MRDTFILTGILAGALCMGCGGKEVGTNDSATTTGTTEGPGTTDGTDGTTTGGTTTDVSETDGTDTTTPTTGEPTTDSTTDDPFMVMPDAPVDCNTFDENCPDGQKCMPYAKESNAWDALKCVDVTGEGKHGDPCTVEESPVSGMDDCQLHAMCWDVDPETNEGFCIAFCDGSSESPSCEPEKTHCIISGVSVINLCFPDCNPLTQDCPDGGACYPLYSNFTCAPVSVPPEEGLEGGACGFVNSCQAGLMCLDSDAYPGGCGGAGGCCSRYCDLSAPECVTPGTECVAIHENPAPGTESYGVCAVPE